MGGGEKEEIHGTNTDHAWGLALEVCEPGQIKVRQGAENLLLLWKEHEVRTIGA